MKATLEEKVDLIGMVAFIGGIKCEPTIKEMIEEFREEQHECFDPSGHAYPNMYYQGIMNRMLKIIDKLTEE